ncbi:RNA dependent RNA polymerase-domain-containing protein [Ephemerocybe angulata]|uniref:RNA-dependent RNA polymerase n=1 Tax=Ephemerocybe angulata TaxID=980116 RepID=A0A8H6IDK6_9AGAR|nr:RNA dependent RNA polymerase-domain-containing protein [Tulosesus angulatus]
MAEGSKHVQQLPVDDNSDLQNFHQDEGFVLSQASSDGYGGDECEELIRGYATQPSTQHVDTGSRSTDTSFEAGPPRTQSSSGSKPGEGSSSSMGSVLGKRKATEDVASKPAPPKKPLPPFQHRTSIEDAPVTFKSYDIPIDKNQPVVNSFPPLSLGLFSKIPYGAQFELMRMVNSIDNFTWRSVGVGAIERLQKVKTNAKAVPLVYQIVKEWIASTASTASLDDGVKLTPLSEQEIKARDPWPELDREVEAISKDPYGAMGYEPDGLPSAWYGGKIQFRGVLHLSKPGEFSLKIEKPTLGPSCEISRRFGSMSLFRIKVAKSAKNDSQKAYEYLCRPFVFCGSVFRAFYAKDDTAFLIKTNEVWNGKGSIGFRSNSSRNMSFMGFIEWFNSLSGNNKQPMAKWASRFTLGLSTSIPGFLLPPNGICFQDDIFNSAGENMTDGAGSVNRWLALRLRQLDESKSPTAIQVRIAGCKGLLVQDPRDYSEEPIVRLTPSQRKINYDTHADSDPAKRSIAILRTSHVKTPCRLSVEVIINLAENGVPKDAFEKILEASLELVIPLFLEWESELALPRIWQALEKFGGVLSARRAREQPGTARARGLSERETDEAEVDDSDGDLVEDLPFEQRSTPWSPDPYSGCPSSLEETVMQLLDAGFTPKDCPVLRDKLKFIVKGYVKRETQGYRVTVPMSATAFIVPDINGVLEEGEIFFKSSARNLQQPDGTTTDVLIGDVLLGRNPCKLPTDVRKWKAVDKPELHGLVDVLVFSTKGKKRAADWLAGGDYDGDKAMVIWHPELVEPFNNASDDLAEQPPGVADAFERQIEQVTDFLERTKNKPEVEVIHGVQYYLLGAIRIRSLVGQYSNCHDVANYKLGYADATTRRLAFMFCLTLDAAKSGMTVRKEISDKDNKEFGQRSPAWKEWKEAVNDEPKVNTRNLAHPRRKKGIGRFIMDDLEILAKAKGSEWLTRIDEVFESENNVEDKHLSAPYREIVSKLNSPGGAFYKADLDLIRRHVEEEYAKDIRRRQEEGRAMSAQNLLYSPTKRSPKKAGGSTSFTDRPIEERQDILRAASRRFAESPDPALLHMPADLAARVKASYAYVYDCEYRKVSPTRVNWSRFPFDVAFRELCDIKARALGNHKTVCSRFYDHVLVKPPKII